MYGIIFIQLPAAPTDRQHCAELVDAAVVSIIAAMCKRDYGVITFRVDLNFYFVLLSFFFVRSFFCFSCNYIKVVSTYQHINNTFLLNPFL